MSLRKVSLFAGTMLVAVASAAGAMAQATAPAGASASTEVGELIVTGSRIPKPNLDQPTPVAVLTTQLIQNSGAVDLGTILAELPALGPNSTIRGNSNSFGNAGGLSFADLRNLGPNRTLVLVDGKRHVAGDPSSAAVDLSSIPPDLVDHVEIITGGASALYGSDAVSGVINIILKKDFQGLQMDAQSGVMEPGGAGATNSLNVTAGTNFDHDRGNIAVSALWNKSEAIMARQIRSLNNYGTIVNPIDLDMNGAPIPNDKITDTFIVPRVYGDVFDENTVLVDFNSGEPISAFTNHGQPVPQQTRTGFNSFAFGSFAGPCATCFATEDYELIQPRTQREGGTLNLHYDVTPRLHFSLDAKFIRNEVYDHDQPSSSTDQQLQPDNAYITPAIAAVLAPITDPTQYPFISRIMSDFGVRTNEITRDTMRVVAGLNGDFDARFANVTWDGSLNFGTTQNHFTAQNIEIPGNFNAAIDSVIDPATGQAACRVNVPSAQPVGYTPPAGMVGPASACVPYNPFGQQNSLAATRYPTTTLHEYQRLVQEVADLNFSFDTSRFFTLPGGPISVAAGGEYRFEHNADKQDPLTIAGLTEDSQTPNFAGGFDVYEGYLEVSMPFVKHRFLIDELTVDGAVRGSRYSTVGTTDAWKISTVYGPIPGLKFRGTYSEAIRAPNITEAFQPAEGTFFFVSDPCDATLITSNVNRTANCAAQGIPAGFVANTNTSVAGTVSGNTALQPEQSKSYTGGIVFQPTFIKHFAVTVDYYDITIRNAITQVAAQDILNNCYDSASLDPTYCSRFTRGADGNVNFIASTYINASELKTNGIEVQTSYDFWTDPLHGKFDTSASLPGKVSLSLDANYLFHLRNFPFQTDPTQQHILEGEVGTPQLRFLAEADYEQGPWKFDWQIRYVDKSARFDKDFTQADFAESISPAYVPAVVYNNLVIHYRLPTERAHAEVYAGANDLFDVQPPIGVIQGNPVGGDGDALYDLGRYIFVGVRVKY